MFKLTFVMCLIGVLSVSAENVTKAAGKQSGEVKADSMVYDQPSEWRIFSIDGPGMAFALDGDILWIASDKSVASLGANSRKKSEIVRYKTLGAMGTEGITCIATDRMGGVWFGGPGGVAVKNGNDFVNYTADNGLSDNMVTDIVVTPDNRVWVGTENGLCSYSAGAWKKFTTAEGLVSGKIQTLLVGKDGKLWAGTDKGISVYSSASGTWTTHSMKNDMSWNDTKALGLDLKTGTVWAAVGERDVNSFDGKSWNVFMDIDAGITSIMVDSQGRVWFGGGAGLIKYNGEEWISGPGKLGIPAAHIHQMYKDNEGNLWYGMENGVIRLENPYPH